MATHASMLPVVNMPSVLISYSPNFRNSYRTSCQRGVDASIGMYHKHWFGLACLGLPSERTVRASRGRALPQTAMFPRLRIHTWSACTGERERHVNRVHEGHYRYSLDKSQGIRRTFMYRDWFSTDFSPAVLPVESRYTWLHKVLVLKYFVLQLQVHLQPSLPLNFGIARPHSVVFLMLFWPGIYLFEHIF